MDQRLLAPRPPARTAPLPLTAWADRRAAIDRRVAESSAAVAEAMRDAGDLAGAADYAREAARLAREAEPIPRVGSGGRYGRSLRRHPGLVDKMLHLVDRGCTAPVT